MQTLCHRPVQLPSFLPPSPSLFRGVYRASGPAVTLFSRSRIAGWPWPRAMEALALCAQPSHVRAMPAFFLHHKGNDRTCTLSLLRAGKAPAKIANHYKKIVTLSLSLAPRAALRCGCVVDCE